MMFYYKNSLLASLFSVAGSYCVAYGLAYSFNGFVEEGAPVILIGIPLFFIGSWISQAKAFRKWWKQVEKAELIPQIRTSNAVAMEIYNKNPQKRTLEKIRKLNPEAAAAIEGR